MSELDVLRETFADYCSVRETLCDLPEISLVAVRRTCDQAAVDQKLFERVTKALADEHSSGWARFRSELGWSGAPPPTFKASGPPIMAEWLDGSGTAHRLSPAPSAVGKALLVAVSHRPLEPRGGLTDGETPALLQRLQVLAHARVAPFTHIAYDVYWGLPENGAPSATRRLFDRFAGFIEEAESRGMN